jgi:hypothetical protein
MAVRRVPTEIALLLGVAIAVSIVHYVDNTANYDDYPLSDDLPNPSQGVVGGAWFFFTAFAVAAVVMLRQGRERAAALCLAVYSGSGLVGILHYTVPGTGDFPWWRHAHIVSDIVLGIAVLAMAVRLARRSA